MNAPKQDPVRLLDVTSSASHELRVLLNSAENDTPNSAHVQQLVNRIAVAVSSPTVPGHVSAWRESLWGVARSVPLKIAFVTAGVLATGVWMYAHDHWTQQPSVLMPHDKSPTALRIPLPQPRSQTTLAKMHLPQKASTVTKPKWRYASETDLLIRAQQALRSDRFNQADRLLRRHARAYPDGLLCEERQAMIIESLARNGSGDRARLALKEFRQRFPDSAYRHRLRTFFLIKKRPARH